MARCCFHIIVAFFVCSCVTAAGIPDQAGANQLSLEIFTAYRSDSLDWNIAGQLDGTSPNILSELEWDNLAIFQVGAEGQIIRPMRKNVDLVLLGRSTYGFIQAGDNQDSDYAGDNRTIEWSRSNNDAGEGHVFDLSGGVGLRFRLKNEDWTLTPQLGYAYNEQDLVMRDGLQTVAIIPAPAPFPNPFPVGTTFPALDSSYYSWWFGPWLGLQADFQWDDIISCDFSLRWHKVDFRAEADWNLRTDLQHPISFEHQADGDGMSLNIGMDYLLGEKWSAGLDLDYIKLKAENGLDIIYLDTGGVGGTRLNEVNWSSWALSFSLQHHF